MPFREPCAKKIGAKFLVYGITGSGKSRFMLTFPDIAVLDTEAGIAFYEGGKHGANLKLVSNTQSFKDFEDDIDEIKDNYEKLGIRTFAVDSVTKVKENLEETIMTIDEKRERGKGKDVDEVNLSIKSRGRIKHVSKKLQNMKIDLSTQGISIVDVAQAKEIKEKRGEQFVLVGYEPDMQKGAIYDYDVVLFTYTEPDGKGGSKFLARVEKDRLEVFNTGAIVEDITYDFWKNTIESRQGEETLSTKFTENIEKTKKSYEEDILLSEQTRLQKLQFIISKLSQEDKTAMQAELKNAGITNLAKIDSLSPQKEEKLDFIIAAYLDKI